MSTFSDLKNEFYRYVADEIDTINSQRGFTEYRAEVYKHYLLCGIELKLNQVFESRLALLHKDLKCKAPLIEPNLRRNLGKWST